MGIGIGLTRSVPYGVPHAGGVRKITDQLSRIYLDRVLCSDFLSRKRWQGFA